MNVTNVPNTPNEAGATDEGAHQFLTFLLKEETFGLNILPIREITEYTRVTSMPMAPDYIRGVINLRGKVVPVIDLPVLFGWEPSPVTKRTCIVVLEQEGPAGTLEIGIVIDSVREVLTIEEIGEPPRFGAQVRTEFILGMGRIDDEFMILLDARKMLSLEEVSTLEQLTPAEPAA